MLLIHNTGEVRTMARLPALVTAYTAMDGRDLTTIKNIARRIREAGFISSTKRGTGASTMTVRDAVNLLLGANGSDTALYAAEAVERLRGLRTFVERHGRDDSDDIVDILMILGRGTDPAPYLQRRSDFPQSMWTELVKAERFGEACEWLILNAAAIEAKMIEFNLSRLAESDRFLKAQSDANRAAIESGVYPAEMRDHAAKWAELKGTSFKLTIDSHEASFQALAPALEDVGFARLRLRFDDGLDCGQSKSARGRPLRRFAEIDFKIILELARLIAPKPPAPGED